MVLVGSRAVRGGRQYHLLSGRMVRSCTIWWSLGDGLVRWHHRPCALMLLVMMMVVMRVKMALWLWWWRWLRWWRLLLAPTRTITRPIPFDRTLRMVMVVVVVERTGHTGVHPEVGEQRGRRIGTGDNASGVASRTHRQVTGQQGFRLGQRQPSAALVQQDRNLGAQVVLELAQH